MHDLRRCADATVPLRTDFARRLMASALAAALLAAAPPSFAYPVFGPEQDIAPTDTVSPQNGRVPVAATDGADFLVAWLGEGVECARFTAGQVLLDQPSIELSIPAPTNWEGPQGPLQAFWDGTKYVVVSQGSAQRVDPTSGAVEAAFVLQGAPAAGTAAVGGGLILDIWQPPATGVGLTGALYDETGSVVQGNLAFTAGAVSEWQVASTGTQFLVTWTVAGTIEATRVSTTGAILDATPIVIDAGNAVDGGVASTTNLNVAASSTGYLVTWNDARQTASVFSARIDSSGTVADPGGILVGPGNIGAAYGAWDGTEWWITANCPPPGTAYEAYAYTIAATGGTVASSIYSGITGADGPGAGIWGIAANPAARLVAWTDSELGGVLATTISPSGVGTIVKTSSGSIDTTVATGWSQQTPVCVAASSSGYLVLYEPASTSAVYGRRFQLDGTPIDATPFAVPAVLAAGTVTPCGAMGDTYYLAAQDLPDSGLYAGEVASLPTSGALAISQNAVDIPIESDAGLTEPFDEYYVTPLSMTCMSDRCLLIWELYYAFGETVATEGMIFGAGGAVIAPPFEVPTAYAATDGTSFIVESSVGADDWATVLPVAADGSLGTLVTETNVPYSNVVVGGGGVFLLASFSASTGAIYRFDGTGLPLGSPESLTVPNDDSLSNFAWEGAGKFFVGLSNGATANGAELSSAPFSGDAGVALSTFPLFNSPTVLSTSVLVASDGSGDVIAVRSQPRLVARFGTPAPDAGPDAGPDGGTEDGGDDGGGLGITDAGPDGGNEDGGGDGGGPGITLDASVDAEGGTASSGDGGGGESPDATIAPTADAAAGDAASGTSGCGCDTAGGGAGSAGAWFSVAALALFVLGRRRRARELRA
jgi:MYXO-CTERM domain-containing protein